MLYYRVYSAKYHMTQLKSAMHIFMFFVSNVSSQLSNKSLHHDKNVNVSLIFVLFFTYNIGE